MIKIAVLLAVPTMAVAGDYCFCPGECAPYQPFQQVYVQPPTEQLDIIVRQVSMDRKRPQKSQDDVMADRATAQVARELFAALDQDRPTLNRQTPAQADGRFTVLGASTEAQPVGPDGMRAMRRFTFAKTSVPMFPAAAVRQSTQVQTQTVTRTLVGSVSQSIVVQGGVSVVNVPPAVLGQ